MVYAYNEHNYVTYTSPQYISDVIYLPEPDPAEVSLKLNEISATSADAVTEDTVGATTNKPESVIYYTSDQNVDVSYFVDGTTDEQVYHVEANRPLEIPVTLSEGSNVIEFMAVNENNDYTMSKLIATLDSTAPELLLNDTTVLSVNGQYELVGTVESNAKVYIGESETPIPVIDGSFSYMGTQSSTRDEITVKAVDIAGNETVMTAEVIPSELSDFVKIKIKNNDLDAETIELYQGDNATLKVYGVDESGNEYALDNSNIDYDVIYGYDKASIDEQGVITANYYGEAIVLCSYNVTDNYSFEETVNVTISQAYEDAKDIRISTTDVLENTAGVAVANLSIPDAPIGVTYSYTVEENEVFDVVGNSVILKKSIDGDWAQFTVTAQGKHVLDGVYSDIGTPITKTFTMKSVKNIVSVAPVTSKTVYRGTTFDKLDLPTELEVTLSNGEVIKCPITWSQSAYNPDVVATYVLKGKIEKPDNVINTDDIYANASVTVKKRSTSRKKTSQPVVEDVTLDYEEETLVVSAKDDVNTITLTDDILSNETDNLTIKIGNVSVTLDNDTVENIKKSQNRTISIAETEGKINVNICGLEQVHGLVSYNPVDKSNLSETNVVVTKDGEIITNSYYDGDEVIFALEANGDYVVETKKYDFGDTTSSWANDYISFVAVRGKINGIGDNQFAPDENVTRAEFLKMIFGALDIEITPTEVLASDVSADDWYAPFVGFAMQNAIVKGYEDGTFKPNNEISREEMMVMLNRCIEYKGIISKTGKINFIDKMDISAWAKDSIANIVAMGLITGNDDGTLKPRSNAKRSECAVVMMRCIKMVTNNMIQ